jgi:hypothetical protein
VRPPSILARLREGVKQIDVAGEFGCLESTIKSVRKAAGLKLFPELTPDLEKKIVRELRRGTGQEATSKKFRVSRCKIRALMSKHKVYHPVGDPGLANAERERIKEAIRRREDYAVNLAKKYGHCPQTVLKLVHQEYGPAPFERERFGLR